MSSGELEPKPIELNDGHGKKMTGTQLKNHVQKKKNTTKNVTDTTKTLKLGNVQNRRI
jgi:hypothetical protein